MAGTFFQSVSAHRGWAVLVGIATILGSVFTALSYCSSPDLTPPDGQPIRNSPPPQRRPATLPATYPWVNASGPPTFQLFSSGVVILPKTTHAPSLHGRFTLKSSARAAAQV